MLLAKVSIRQHHLKNAMPAFVTVRVNAQTWETVGLAVSTGKKVGRTRPLWSPWQLRPFTICQLKR